MPSPGRDSRAERPTVVPIWVVWLLRFQVGMVYFFSGLAKVNGDWLLRGEPLATWLPARADLPSARAPVHHPGDRDRPGLARGPLRPHNRGLALLEADPCPCLRSAGGVPHPHLGSLPRDRGLSPPDDTGGHGLLRSRLASTPHRPSAGESSPSPLPMAGARNRARRHLRGAHGRPAPPSSLGAGRCQMDR